MQAKVYLYHQVNLYQDIFTASKLQFSNSKVFSHLLCQEKWGLPLGFHKCIILSKRFNQYRTIFSYLQRDVTTFCLFTSRISSQDNRIGPICVRVWGIQDYVVHHQPALCCALFWERGFNPNPAYRKEFWAKGYYMGGRGRCMKHQAFSFLMKKHPCTCTEHDF